MLLIFLSTLFFGIVTAGIDVGSFLTGRIIHIESGKNRGSWLDSYNGKYIKFSGLPQKYTYGADWTKFKVIKCGNSKHITCLESLRYPNRYLDAYNGNYVKLSYAVYPQDKTWAQFKIMCVDKSYTNCVIQSVKHHKYICLSGKWAIYSGYTGSTCDIRVLAPAASQYYKTILSTENHSGVDQHKTITMHEGVSTTEESTITISASVSAEIYGATVELSTEWSQMSSKTFEKSTTITYEIIIPANTKIRFQQLTGEYGPFSIAAKKFKILKTKLK